jgi:hypothetical protein
MSATPTPIRECDAALDYLYGLLEGEAKARFETHLATCARCQEELAAFGKVRAIAKAALPPVEPSERLTGALHAQLLHAAAQRKPKGKVLPFMRRVFRHPAYAAAAGILIIGGAVGLEWSRGKLLPPTHAVVANDSTTVTAAATQATPTAAPVPVVPAESAPTKELTTVKADEDKAPAKPMVAKPSLLQRPKVEKSAGFDDADGSKNVGGLVGKSRGFKQDGLDDLLEGDAVGGGGASGEHKRAEVKPSPSTGNRNAYNGWSSGPSTRSDPMGDARSAGTGAAAPTNAKKLAPAASPPPEPRKTPVDDSSPRADSPPAAHHAAPREEDNLYKLENQRAKDKSADEERRPSSERTMAKAETAAPQRSEAPQAQAPMPATVVPPGDVAGSNDSKAGDDQNKIALGATSTETRDANDSIDTERSRGSALAQAGRCEEAVTVFKAIERRVPTRLTPQDRLSYERCLRTLGRIEPAQQELNQLRSNSQLKSAMPAASVQAEQKAIDIDRKRQANRRAAKAKKSAAPASNAATAPVNADSDNADAATKQR